MTQEQYDAIKKRFPTFAKTVEYWSLVRANSKQGSLNWYFADGYIDGTANCMIEQVGLGNEAFEFANIAKAMADRRVNEAKRNGDSEGSV